LWKHRQQAVRGLLGAGLRQEQHLVLGDGLVQRRAQLLPVREQLGDGLGVHHGARQDVRAGLGALLQHHDVDLGALLGSQLLQADRGGQPGRATADDHHVVFHRFAGAVLGKKLGGSHGLSLGGI
jgi:hypothetical protein